MRGALHLLSLDELVLAARSGVDGAFDEVVRRFRPMAATVSRRWVDPSVADDVAQEALLEVLGSLEDLRSPFALPLLVRLAVRKHADRHIRRTRHHQPLGPELPEEVVDGDPAILTERNHLVATVRAALQEAPDPDRRLLELRYIAEWSIRDLATASGLTEGAVRKRLYDARRRLRPALTVADLAPTSRRQPMPDPTSFLGLTYLADGTPADEALEPLTGTPPLPEFDTVAELRSPRPERLVTGLTVIDLLAPLVRGGVHDIVGPFGTGHLVLARDLVARANRSRATAAVAVGSRHWHKGGFSNFRKFGAASNPELHRFATIIASDESDTETALHRGTRLANALLEHRDVLLIVDDALASAAGPPPTHLNHGVTEDDRALTIIHVDPFGEGFEVPERTDYDARITLSLDLAARGLFPAIDPERSDSALLRTQDDAAARARGVRKLLAAARQLADSLTQGLVSKTSTDRTWLDPSAASREVDSLISTMTARSDE